MSGKTREDKIVELLERYEREGKMSTDLWGELYTWVSQNMRYHYKSNTHDTEAINERVIKFMEFFREERDKTIIARRQRRAKKTKKKQPTIPDIRTIVVRWRHLTPRIELWYYLKSKGINVYDEKSKKSLYEFFKGQELIDWTELTTIEKLYKPTTYHNWLRAFIDYRTEKKNKFVGRQARLSFLFRVYKYIAALEARDNVEHRNLKE